MTVHLARREAVAILTLDRQDVLNALSFAMLREIGEAIDQVAQSDARALIVTGAGTKAFCAGVLALGCAVALDDFGAGFGSFQYLKHLPFTYLKIDGDFIRRLSVSRTDQLVVKALAGVVRGMGRQTIAEFVGDVPTMSMLRSYGVDYAQGFEVGRPAARIPVTA